MNVWKITCVYMLVHVLVSVCPYVFISDHICLFISACSCVFVDLSKGSHLNLSNFHLSSCLCALDRALTIGIIRGTLVMFTD